MGMKKTEIGMIPEEWDVQNFSDTFRVLNNNTYSRTELNYYSGQFRNIHYGDVLILFPEVLDCAREDVPYINDGVRISNSAQPLQDGDVVIADTAEDETVGKVTEVINTSDKPVMAGLHTIPCRVKSGEFAPKWLGYYMNSHLYHDQLLPYIHGTKVSAVSKGSLGDTIIIVPKASEQEKIVKALSDVDLLIEDLKKLIQKKKDIRQGTIQSLVSGKRRLDGFAKPWKCVHFSEICSISAPMVNPCEQQYALLPHIGNESIEKHTGRLLEYNKVIDDNLISGKYFFTETDVLYGKINPQFGKVAYPQFCGLCSADMYPISCKAGLIPDYLKYVLLTYDFLQYTIALSLRSGMPKVNRKELSNYEFIVPEENEQKAIVGILSDMDLEIEKLEEKLSKYQKIKQGMMEELLTGKIRLV